MPTSITTLSNSESGSNCRTSLNQVITVVNGYAVDVALAATGGAGTSGDPWTGWDTAITWTEFTRYVFRSGYFSYVDSPNFAKKGIQLVGSAGTILKHTGTGVGFKMDASASEGTWIMNVLVENLILLGNANTTNGFFIRGIRDGAFNNLSVRGCTNAGIWTEACVTNILSNFRCMFQEPDQGGAFAVTPKNGIVFTGRGADWSTTWTVINPVIEGVSEEGIWLKSDSYGATIINGTSESNTGATQAAFRISGPYNVVINTDCEQNTSNLNFLVEGDDNILQNVFSDQTSKIQGSHNQVIGGRFVTLLMDNAGACYRNMVLNSNIDTFTDNGTFTQSMGSLGRRGKIGAPLPSITTTSIAAGHVATDCSGGNIFDLTANANYVLDNPTNAIDGQIVTWRIANTAGITVTFGAQFVCTAPMWTLAEISALMLALTGTIYVTAIYRSSGTKWDIIEVSSTGTPELTLQGSGLIDAQYIYGVAGADMHIRAKSSHKLYLGGNATFGGQLQLNASGAAFPGTLPIMLTADSTSYGTPDLFIVRKAAASFQLGQDAAGVTNQLLTAANRITSDGVGANLTIAPGNGRGGAGGSLILGTFDTGASGVAGTLQARITIDTAGAVQFGGGAIGLYNATPTTQAGAITPPAGDSGSGGDTVNQTTLNTTLSDLQTAVGSIITALHNIGITA